MDNINNSYEIFTSIKIISEELIKYLNNYKQISSEHLKQLRLFDNNINIKLEDQKLSQIIILIYKIKEVIKLNIDYLNCSIEDINLFIKNFENNLKEKENIINDLKESSLYLGDNLFSSHQEITKTGNTYISSLSKTEDIIDNFYINKIKIRDHENGLGNKLKDDEYNLIKEQQKIQFNEMNNAIKLSKKYEEFHKGAISASNKIYDEFIGACNQHRNKIKDNICEISKQIKEMILFFFVSFKSVYNQPMILIEKFIKEFNDLDEYKEMNNIIEKNYLYNNQLKKSEPIKYKLKSFQFLKDIYYIKDDKDLNESIINNKIIEKEKNNNSLINRKIVKALDDDFHKLYYISDDASMLTIKKIFENYDLIEKENFDIKLEESKNKTQRYTMKIIENINSNENMKRNELSDNELTDLINLLNEHDNRIIFLQKLSDFRVKGKYNLCEKDYIILCKLFKILCDNIKKYSDYHSAELLIVLSQSYYIMHNKEKKYIQKAIKENILFKEKSFWEEYLCYSINKEIVKMLNIDKKIQEDKAITDYKYANIVFTQILTVVNNMIEFNLDTNIIKEVLEPKINVYRLNDDLKSTINEVIQSAETNLKIQNENGNE